MATKLHDDGWLEETIRRLAVEIGSDWSGGERKALVGVRTRGALVAERLAVLLRKAGHDFDLGFLDTTMYRDDIHCGGGLKEIKATEIPFDINDCSLVLVDDVVATGRTVRAAMNALFGFGRPARIRLLAMLDRGGRHLPIQPDFTGARVEVPAGGFVRLRLKEVDAADAVYLVAPGEEEPA